MIKATSEWADWEAWIETGPKPLLRKFVPDLKKLIERTRSTNPRYAVLAEAQITNTITLDDWQVDPEFTADTFAFVPPEGAKKVDSMDALFGREMSQPPSPLLGMEAPPVKLDLLDGGTLDLQNLKDKNVVILDFWATWCGPCVKAMPIIDKVAADYKDKGVLLYAVNIREEPADVQKFLNDAGLHVSVALDKEGAVATAYGATAIHRPC